MPFEVRHLDDGEGLLLKGYAPLTGKDKIEINDYFLRSAGELAKLRYAVIDKQCAELQMSSTEIRITAAQDIELAKHIPPGLVVAVVSRSDVDFGMSRMWEVFVEDTGWRTRVFRSADHAAVWLKEIVGENTYSSSVGKDLGVCACKTSSAA